MRQIATTLYHDAPVNEPGNDDLGAISSWYVWAAIGLYPVTPATANLARREPAVSRGIGRASRRAAHRGDRARRRRGQPVCPVPDGHWSEPDSQEQLRRIMWSGGRPAGTGLGQRQLGHAVAPVGSAQDRGQPGVRARLDSGPDLGGRTRRGPAVLRNRRRPRRRLHASRRLGHPRGRSPGGPHARDPVRLGLDSEVSWTASTTSGLSVSTSKGVLSAGSQSPGGPGSCSSPPPVTRTVELTPRTGAEGAQQVRFEMKDASTGQLLPPVVLDVRVRPSG